MRDLQEIPTPFLSPPPSTHETPTSFSLECSNERPPHFRSLQEIYEITENKRGNHVKLH